MILCSSCDVLFRIWNKTDVILRPRRSLEIINIKNSSWCVAEPSYLLSSFIFDALCRAGDGEVHFSPHLTAYTSDRNVRLLIPLGEFKVQTFSQGTAKAFISGRQSPLQYAAVLVSDLSSCNQTTSKALLEQLQWILHSCYWKANPAFSFPFSKLHSFSHCLILLVKHGNYEK